MFFGMAGISYLKFKGTHRLSFQDHSVTIYDSMATLGEHILNYWQGVLIFLKLAVD